MVRQDNCKNSNMPGNKKGAWESHAPIYHYVMLWLEISEVIFVVNKSCTVFFVPVFKILYS